MLRIAEIESRRYTFNTLSVLCNDRNYVSSFTLTHLLLISQTFYFIIFSLPIFIVAEQLEPCEPPK